MALRGLEMARYLPLIARFVAQNLKSRLAYPADFWTGLASDLVHQAANLVFILVVFQHAPSLHGWRREEVVFIYGYFLVPFAVFHATAANLWDFADRYVVRGEFDRVLTRPLPSLLQVFLETMELESLLGAVTGVAAMAWAGRALGLDWRLADLAIFPVLVAGGVAIYYGIFIALAAVAFWTDSRTGLIPLLWNLNAYGRYPVDIYSRRLRFVFTWVLPLAFVGFFPAAYFLRRGAWGWYAALTPAVGALVLAFGVAVWSAGVRRYRGAGS